MDGCKWLKNRKFSVDESYETINEYKNLVKIAQSNSEWLEIILNIQL